jgi:hypothetical protein
MLYFKYGVKILAQTKRRIDEAEAWTPAFLAIAALISGYAFTTFTVVLAGTTTAVGD